MLNIKIMESIKLTVKQLILNIKYIFSNFTPVFSLVFFLIVGVTLPIVFFPYFVIAGVETIISISIPLLLILGGISYNWKNSTLHQNEQITKSNKITYWVSIVLVLFFVGNLQTILMEVMNYICSSFGLFLENWSFLSDQTIPVLNYSNINFINYFYFTEINLMLVFSLFFLISRFFKNVKNYYICVLLMFILSVIFGGGLNEFFGGLDYMGKKGEGDTLFNTFPSFKPSMFPKYMFLPSLIICPFFTISEFYTHSIAIHLSGATWGHYNVHDRSLILLFVFSFTDNSWQWSIVMLMPYIWMASSFSIGVLHNHLSRK